MFLLFDCFKWVLIDRIIKCRLHSMLWQFQMGGSICLWYLHVFSMHWYFLISSIILPLVSTCLLYVLLFPYVFLLFDCFEWVLIDHIEKCRGHSALWQFQMGGPSLISSYYLTVLNGHSLTVLKSIEVTQHSGSFKWGGQLADLP